VTAIMLALGASLAWGFADFGAGVGSRRLPVFVVAAVTGGWSMHISWKPSAGQAARLAAGKAASAASASAAVATRRAR